MGEYWALLCNLKQTEIQTPLLKIMCNYFSSWLQSWSQDGCINHISANINQRNDCPREMGIYYMTGQSVSRVKLEGPQVAQARNFSIGEHRHCCITFEIWGFVREKTYHFCNLQKWKDFNKKQLTLHKMCVTSLLCGPWADLWPFYGLYCSLDYE